MFLLNDLEQCPGCEAQLPKFDRPTHRYIGASAACWELFSNLQNAGEPPLAPAPLNVLLTDAYTAQHPGTPSAQSIQSVAVHLLTLYGVLQRGIAPSNVHWIRRRAVRGDKDVRHGRFQWLTPPSFAGCLTVADIVAGDTAVARANLVQEYVEQVLSVWAETHLLTLVTWYDKFIVADGL